MNLFSATLELATKLTTVREGSASYVDTSYITDGTAAFINGLWQGGTIWLHDTVPTSKVIETSGVDRINFAVGTIPSEGVGYSLANRDYPRDVLRQAINDAIKELHPAYAEDVTLVTVANQVEYDLPAWAINLLKVEIEYYDDGSQKLYRVNQTWQEVGAKLRFFGCVPELSDKTIRLTYRVDPPRLVDDSAMIPAGIDNELLIWRAAAHALRWGLEQYGQDQTKRVPERLNEAQAEIARRGGNKKMYQKSTILSGW